MDRIVLVTGAGGPAGRAVTDRLTAGGDTVLAVGRDPAKLPPAAERHTVDLLDRSAVRELARDTAARYGRLDGVIHLVGGWRGAASFAETSLADWDLLHDLLIRTLQHVSLAFEPLLRASAAGRFAIVSATAAAEPRQGGAAYAAAKAAAEAWTLALADALRGTGAAACVLVVKALVDAETRRADPGAGFAGFTDVTTLAEAVAGLWDRDAAEINARRLDLTP